MATTSNPRDLTGGMMSFKDVCTYLSVGPSALDSLCRQRVLPVVRVGPRLRRIPRSAALTYANGLLARANEAEVNDDAAGSE
jgi:excisionase family DNA binding protein